MKVYARVRPLNPTEVEKLENQVSGWDKAGLGTISQEFLCNTERRDVTEQMQYGCSRGFPTVVGNSKSEAFTLPLRDASVLRIPRPFYSKHPRTPSQ